MAIDLDIKKAFIKKQPVFSQLHEDGIEVLASLLTEKNLSPNDVIVNEGEPVDSVYFIVSGQADVRHVFIKDNQTEIRSLATLYPGDVIGLNEAGFYSLSGVRTATVVAETEMVLLRLSMAAFHGFALMSPGVNELMRKNAANFLNFKS